MNFICSKCGVKSPGEHITFDLGEKADVLSQADAVTSKAQSVFNNYRLAFDRHSPFCLSAEEIAKRLGGAFVGALRLTQKDFREALKSRFFQMDWDYCFTVSGDQNRVEADRFFALLRRNKYLADQDDELLRDFMHLAGLKGTDERTRGRSKMLDLDEESSTPEKDDDLVLCSAEIKLVFSPAYSSDEKIASGVEYRTAPNTPFAPLTLQKRCPHCFEAVSSMAGTMNEIVIAVMGSQRIGKSACLTAAVYGYMKGDSVRLDSQRISRGIDWTVPLNEPGWIDFTEKYLSHYENGQNITKTADEQSRAPSFSVTVSVTRGHKKGQYLLTFVDIPGEYLTSPERRDAWYEQYRALYENVDCFWLCVDGSQIRDELRPDTRYGHDVADVDKTADLQHLLQTFEYVRRQMLSERPTFPPTAIILTKSDVEKVRTPQTEWNELLFTETDDIYSLEKKVFNYQQMALRESSFVQLSTIVRDYLIQIGSDVTKRLESIFDNRAFFAMAAYGYHPLNADRDEPRPYGVQLPFLWTMAVLGKLEILSRYEKEEYLGTMYKDGKRNMRVWRNLCLLNRDSAERPRYEPPRMRRP